MMKTRTKVLGVLGWAAVALAPGVAADSSAIATMLIMSFDGELTSTSVWNPAQTIEDQLLYTIGSLNASNAVGRLDKVVLTNVAVTSNGGRVRVKYHAQLPVAWGSKTNLPTAFTLTLPRDVSPAGQEAFAARYGHSCVDSGAHDVDAGSMFFYFRPGASSCSLDEADIVRSTASTVVSPVNTTGKFPEYNKVWEDGELNVIAIFGKYEKGATSGDAGIDAYNEFIRASKIRLSGRGAAYVSVPSVVPSSPGVSTPMIEQRSRLPDGKRVAVFAFLVDSLGNASSTFDVQYGQLSGRADLIVYNGHTGLGTDVRALARKGRWIAGQYVMVFMDGSDTFAYLDSLLFDSHTALNADDPIGTKYVDVIVNAMPSFFALRSAATMAFLSGLLSYDAPRSYEQILGAVDSSQVVLVTGEGDNTFVPDDLDPGLPIHVQSAVTKNEAKRVTTRTLPAGIYLVTLAHDPAAPGGDADLYVRIGAEPTTSTYDCRPYKNGSNESCRLELAAPAQLFTVVRGYADRSNAYILTIAADGGV